MSGIVKLDVGESRAPFDVHLELLCACSPYFDLLFSKRTEKSLDDQAIHLPDLDPDLFAEIVLWMYCSKHSLGGLQRKKMNFLLKLWLLAKNLEIPELQDSLMPLLKGRAQEDTREILCNDAVDLIYTQTLPNSPLRHLVVDIYINGSKAERKAMNVQDSPRQFLEEVCWALPDEGKEWMGLPLPSLDQTNRYYVSHSLAQTVYADFREETDDFRGETDEIRQPATPAQMRSRKFKNLPTHHKGTHSVQRSFNKGNEAEPSGELPQNEHGSSLSQ
ncbi:hypothetical protein N7509_003882 [Penicillium cosmopolitanum]|uniref:BTB domain-containing protein n=1 Tax=Penicillium cosmopolitanum TaxID=1131564 RepID=A0A9W9W5Y7_9EURO|nr:uncharacterized protein N7509_003882 [Penicillium cosmopolitanum]KAJ5404011.1 hypothetical protein N7509_003882 [Penicillium cosmopolitanum]